MTQAAGGEGYSVSRSAFKVALGGVLSLSAGLASQMAIASIFGAGSEMDAFLTAMVVPVYLQIVLLGGLEFVFIPAFVHEETAGHEDDAWSLAGTFVYLTAGILLVVGVVVALLAPQIVALTAPGFSPAKSALAAQMLSIMIFAVPLAGLGSLGVGIQNVRNRFFWPAAATAIGSTGNLITLIVLHRSIGPMALAIGYVVSAVLQASVTVVPVLRHRWKRVLPVRDRRVREMARLIAPFIIFGMFTSSKLVFERYFASGLPDGQLSFIGYAYKISNIFVILMAAGIASAIFPAMARAFSLKGEAGLVEQTEYGVRLTFALALPAVTICTAAAVPLITVLLERGAFVHAVTLSVAILIPIAMLNDVLFRMVSNIIGRTFFVLKDTLTSNLVSSLTIVVYVLMGRWLTARWGYVGLAAAQPIQAGLAVVILVVLLVRKIPALHVGFLTRQVLLYSLASLAAGLGGWGVAQLSSALPAFLQLVLVLAAAVGIYLILLLAIDHDITVAVLEMAGIYKILSAAKLRFKTMNQIPHE